MYELLVVYSNMQGPIEERFYIPLIVWTSICIVKRERDDKIE